MADEKTSTETPKKEQAQAPAEEKVERARLIAESNAFFKCGPHVVAGALSGLDRRVHSFAPSEIKAEIDKFLKRKVKEA